MRRWMRNKPQKRMDVPGYRIITEQIRVRHQTTPPPNTPTHRTHETAAAPARLNPRCHDGTSTAWLPRWHNSTLAASLSQLPHSCRMGCSSTLAGCRSRDLARSPHHRATAVGRVGMPRRSPVAHSKAENWAWHARCVLAAFQGVCTPAGVCAAQRRIARAAPTDAHLLGSVSLDSSHFAAPPPQPSRCNGSPFVSRELPVPLDLLLLRAEHAGVCLSALVLLPARLPPPDLLEVPAARHRAGRRGARARVDVQQRPDLAAGGTPALHLGLALAGVLEEQPHLAAAVTVARRVAAAACVHQQLHRALELLGALPPLLLGEARARLIQALHVRLERVRVANALLAAGADVKVTAHGASEAGAGLHLGGAYVAGKSKRGRVWVVQVVEYHHAAVLCAPHCVKLVVIALAKVEERLARDQVLALELRVRVGDVRRVWLQLDEHEPVGRDAGRQPDVRAALAKAPHLVAVAVLA
eukprot:350955-Chlamydomonas_euryale.AAC.2